jgi:voltage-gated potassium channel
MSADLSPKQDHQAAAAAYQSSTGAASDASGLTGWRAKGHGIIFKADTYAGKAFDLWLIIAILGSVSVVMLDSVDGLNARYGKLFGFLEWAFTLLFSIEYVLRLACSPQPWRYARSFWGIVDLFSILPTFVSLGHKKARVLVVIRTLRILRLFQILRLGRYMDELEALSGALRKGARKILVFLYVVCTLVILLGGIMYLAESHAGSGFSSIPRSVYWAIVTMTTVGYGDISPVTPIGQSIAAVVMLLGYSIIVIPMGIISAELVRTGRRTAEGPRPSALDCTACGAQMHDRDARFCKLCGASLASAPEPGESPS